MSIYYVRPPVADLLEEPSPKAGRVSQLLCFSSCEVIEEKGDFLFVRGPDGYEGWIRRSHLFSGPIPEPRFKISNPVVPIWDAHAPRVIFRLCLDTRFAGEPTDQGLKLRLPTGEVGIVPKGAARALTWRGTIGDVLGLGLSLQGVPYLWGGTTPFGFDCSGLVQRLFHYVFNFWLPRDSHEQARIGEPVEGTEELRAGDLLFFPGHVAIYLGNRWALHASSREGMVVARPLSSFSQKLLGVRRLVGKLIDPEEPGS